MREIKDFGPKKYALTLRPHADGSTRELTVTVWRGPYEIAVEELQAMQEGLDRLAARAGSKEDAA